jgi:hypothetical protein
LREKSVLIECRDVDDLMRYSFESTQICISTFNVL